MKTSIEVKYEYTANPYQAGQWLKSLPDIVALDFEAASRFPPEYVEEYKRIAKLKCTRPSIVHMCNQRAKATGLSHPSLTKLTHMSLAVSPSKAYVFLFEQPAMQKLLMHWLVTTDIKQIWHNASFDFKHIYYHTDGQLPKDYEDTQLLAKTILNHVETFKAKTGLKELAGHAYGDWGIAADNFDMSNIRDEKVIKYAGIDACSTFWLWESIQRHLSVQATNDGKL